LKLKEFGGISLRPEESRYR